MLLAFPASVPKAPEAMEADRADERVPALAFAEFDRGIAPQLWVFKPVEREKGTLDPSDFSQCQ